MIVKIGEPITSAGVMPSLLAPLNWMNSLKSVGLAVELGRYFPCSIRIAKLPVSIGNWSMRYYSTSMRGLLVKRTENVWEPTENSPNQNPYSPRVSDLLPMKSNTGATHLIKTQGNV